MPIKRITLFLLLVLILAACQAAPAVPTEGPAPQATAPAVEQPDPGGYPAGGTSEVQAQPTLPGDYPAQGETGAAQPEPTLPADYPGPAQAPAVDNRSTVSATLIEQAPDAQDPSYTRLKVQVISSAAPDNAPEFTSQLVGQEADFLVLTANLPALAPGDTFEAEVTYEGDESGGRYYATNITKQ